MPTRANFRATLMILVAFSAAMTLPRVWAARHSVTDSGNALGTVADAIQATI